MEDNVGIKGIKYGNLPIGVGFVIIPKDIDPELYKNDCYRTGRVSIFGGEGHSNFYNILIDKEVLQEIEFPEKSGSNGSPVVWVNLPKHNEPIVIASLKYDEKSYNFQEFSKKITKTFGENIVELFLDAKNGKIKLSSNCQNEKVFSDFEISLNSKNSDSKFTVRVDGQVIVHSTKKLILYSSESIQSAVTNKEGIVVSRFSLDNGEDKIRARYEDEYGNKITISEEKINFIANKSKKIDFGSGAEPLVLAKTLKSLLDQYDDALSKMTVPTAFGPSGTRINDSEFRSVRAKFETFFSKLTNSD